MLASSAPSELGYQDILGKSSKNTRLEQGWLFLSGNSLLTAEMGALKGPAAEKVLVLTSLTTQTVRDQVRADASDAQASVRTS